MNFKSPNYSRLTKRLKLRYQKDLKSVEKGLRNFPERDTSRWVMENIDELQAYSGLNWHFLSQLKLLYFLVNQPDELGEKEFGEAEENVFEKWNKSDFSLEFLRALNKGLTVGKASQLTLKIFDKHLVTFAQRNIQRKNVSQLHYRTQLPMGEVKKGKSISRLLETTLHIEGKDLRLMTRTLKEMKLFSLRIEMALKIIKKFSSSSWERFEAFTEVIVPIQDRELVSYSQQDLPGYSMINLYHRDFVDLLDDLLHENGHHHLNYYLNLEKLIEEPEDQIYFSPWRSTPRPLRGIYHAYFTFFWAFKLFADLARAKEVDSIFYVFKKDEKEKIYWRAVEEYYMLSYVWQDLKWARRRGLIHDSGWELVKEQQKELTKFKKLIEVWEKKTGKYKSEVKALKETLKKAKKKFSKS